MSNFKVDFYFYLFKKTKIELNKLEFIFNYFLQ